jgi:lysophospholipase L1-like esterase
VTVQESDRETLLRWHDALYAAIPPVVYTPEPGRFMLLQNTMRQLRSGPALRMVMLGDSIINDIANSLFHVLLERRYPRTQVQLVHSVGGGKGCWYFKAENRLQAAVFGHRPDMVVIGGASHGNDLESIREVIREVRRATQADVLLTTDAFLEFGWTQQYRQQGFIPAAAKAKALEDNRRFRQQLRQLADEEQAAFLDVREHWNRYVDASPKPLKWYQRDYVHANARGQEVVARILDGFFSDR